MNNNQRNAYITRESILELLTDDEVAKVSNAENAIRLAEGDEYLDLERIAQGVQRASGAAMPTENLVPKNAVHANSWNKILSRLGKPRHEKTRAM